MSTLLPTATRFALHSVGEAKSVFYTPDRGYFALDNGAGPSGNKDKKPDEELQPQYAIQERHGPEAIGKLLHHDIV
ncbi:hypothetical protein DFQ27_007295 [Actinomortierella ambigua]|uniref:Uncharacterized protein n=1 Tax=Actinomortierella ambigua TaxID=1343610 RepID=A0A9P6TZT6_9FUNG|nr:hypothetical protein DFQ27_007295 [Actinomortierella ambigua]